ncbi:hypothetical protein Tco_0763278 [Tanacetum coccineum]
MIGGVWMHPSVTFDPFYGLGLLLLLFQSSRTIPEIFTKVSRPRKPIKIISALKARTVISYGCEGFVASIKDISLEGPRLESHLVVQNFLDELLGLPPEREVEFTIELIPSAEPISKAPYRMAPVELKELKDQLQELLEHGFIRSSVSPWGVPVLFVKKKDESMRSKAIPKQPFVLVTVIMSFSGKVAFLGHIVSADGITMDLVKVETITKWPRPTMITKVRSFLGLVGYYRRLVEGFTLLDLPLMKHMRKGEKIVWNEEREKSFKS